jgi:AraC family transcriptional regulator
MARKLEVNNVSDMNRDRATEIDANPITKHVGDDNPIWCFAGFHVEATRCWGLISADIVNRDAGEATWLSDRHRIVYAITDVAGLVQSDGWPADEYGLHREKIAFRPAGQIVRSNLPGPVRVIQILQSPDVYRNLADDQVRGGVVHLEPRANMDDPLISRLVLALVNDIKGGCLDHVLADSLSTALAVRIIQQYTDPSAINIAPSNGLSRERLTRVCDYIEAHLDERLTMTEIAGVACLSPYHFSRSFKQAVGVGPWRYVLQRRVSRAKVLLRRTAQPLSWIAQETGFSDQSHLTAEFRRQVGATPGRFRSAFNSAGPAKLT